MAEVTTLERPLYSYAEGARLLDIPTATLRWWLNGGNRAGVRYPPVIRPKTTDADAVTWGEFVEAGLLRGYRQKRVPLQRMRPFIQRMRERTGMAYPLAHHRPLVDPAGRKLLYEVQDETGLPPSMHLIEFEHGQTVLAPVIVEFLERVEFERAGPVERYWPLGKDKPVAIDPQVSFGVPQIRGIRTELLAEAVDAGETVADAATSWGMSRDDVKAALSWEHRHRAA